MKNQEKADKSHGSLWLRLTGGDDVKALLRGVLGSEQDVAILNRFQTGGDTHLSEVVAQSLPRLAGVLPGEAT